MIKIAFCDDNPNVINLIDALMPEMEFNTAVDWDLFGSGRELLAYLQKEEEDYNIYVLDIEMPEPNGIETANVIRQNDKTAVLIFLTDFKEYVYQVFEALPFRFLEKPIETDKLQKALASALEHIQTVKALFFFRVGHEQMQWPIGDIKYFESSGRKVILHAGKKQFTFYGKLNEVWKQLDQCIFARPHSSYIVNLEFIRSIKQDEIIIADHIVIPISKRHKTGFKEDYMQFVERRNGIK